MIRCIRFFLLILAVIASVSFAVSQQGPKQMVVSSIQDSITGKVFNDLNGNSIFEVEPLLAGWTIQLHADSANGTLLQSTTSDSLGKFKLFIPKGTFAVTESLPAGWAKSKPMTAGYQITTNDTIIQGFVGKDFGNFQLGVLRVELTIDNDGDGNREAADTASLPSGQRAIFQTKRGGNFYRLDTLGDGVRGFTVSDLYPGIYLIEQLEKPSGWTQTYGSVKTVSFTRSGKRDTARYMDFKTVSIGGTVYNDANINSSDDGESGLAGWTIELRRDTVTGTVVARDTTDGSGIYLFAGVGTGRYVVKSVAQSGWIRTQPALQPYYVNTSVSGQDQLSGDFGYYLGGTIRGNVFFDRNGNGTQDSGEDGLTGWTITAVNADPLLNRSAVSQPGGGYTIVGLTPGSYTVTMTQKSGWVQTAPGGLTYTVSTAVGSDSSGFDFANKPPVVTQMYRTFISDSLNMKPAKKKLAMTHWSFTLRNLSGSTVTGLYIKFNNTVLSIDSAGGFTTSTQLGRKEWQCQGDSLADSASVTIYGTGSGKAMAIARYWWLSGTTIKGKKQGAVAPASIEYLYALPNGGNLAAEVYARGFTAFNRSSLPGMVLGTVRKDSARKFSWAYLRTASDFRTSLLDKSGKHTGVARGFAVYQSRAWVGQKSNVGPSRHNNVLVADLMALKLSIAASAYGITPPGLGELVYEEGTNPLSGKMLKEIVNVADSMVTYYSGKPSSVYINLDTTIHKLNGTFAAAMDTTTYADSLTIPGVRGIDSIAWLRPSPPGVTPLVIYAPPAFVDEQEPEKFTLYQNYPNPFNPTTAIQFDLPAVSMVSLKIYNMLGQEVAVLVEHEQLEDGAHTFDFNASEMPSGVYFYRMIAEEIVSSDEDAAPRKFMDVKKMLLVK